MRALIRVLTTLHIFRVPVTILALLIALPWISLGPANALLANLLRELSLGEVYAVAVVTALTTFSAVTAIRLVLDFGDERFGQAVKWFQPYRNWPIRWIGFVSITPLLATVVFFAEAGCARAALAAIAGVGTSVAGALFARGVQAFITAPRGNAARSVNNRIRRFVSHVPHWLGAGYLRYRASVAVDIHAGHVFALCLMAVSFAFYLFGGRHIPTLAYVMILILLASWMLSALAFFGDRYRIPVLTLFFLLSLTSSVLSDTDHYFPVYRIGEPLPDPGKMLAMAPDGAAILIAAEGGGIQAAAWSARVLAGLEQSIPNGRFGRSVRLISGVSGGSVGAFYFANAFFQNRQADPAALDRAWRSAMESSLDEVAWGLTNPDLQRVFTPLGWLVRRDRFDDRGRALERTFETRAGQRAMLSDWARVTARGDMPPVIFNATIAERGSPLVFSTTLYPPADNGSALRLDYDLAVSTAVRLSATFPIVSPAARPYTPDGEAPMLHVVDGGYYDNLGVSSLIGWLRHAKQSPSAAHVRRVLILKLHSFPRTAEASGSSRGWLYQFHAPLDTIMNMRNAAQVHRAETEIAMLAEAWRGEAEVHRLDVRFPGCESASPPLSWRLRSDQKRCIEQAWESMRIGVTREVESFLDRRKPAGLRVNHIYQPCFSRISSYLGNGSSVNSR